MPRRFVIEAVMVATYGHLLVPSSAIDYVVPYSSILELYDMRDGSDPVMEDPDDDAHVKNKIGELIAFLKIRSTVKKSNVRCRYLGGKARRCC